MSFWLTIQFWFGIIGGWIGHYLGAGDGMVITLIIFIVLDLLSLLMVDITRKTLSSARGFKLICEKLLILFFVALGNILDTHVIKTGSVLRTAVILFYMANEGLSMIESASLLGLSIPSKLKNVLEMLQKESESTDATTEEKETNK